MRDGQKSLCVRLDVEILTHSGGASPCPPLPPADWSASRALMARVIHPAQ